MWPASSPKLLAEALRRDIDFIARPREDYPQALLQGVWNHGWWYDCSPAAEHYLAPEKGWSELPSWRAEEPEPKLSEAIRKGHLGCNSVLEGRIRLMARESSQHQMDGGNADLAFA